MSFQFADLNLLMPHIVLTLTALVCLLAEAFSPGSRKGYLSYLSLAGIILAAFFTVGYFEAPRVGFNRMLAGDGFAGFFAAISYVVGGLVDVYFILREEVDQIGPQEVFVEGSGATLGEPVAGEPK